MSTSRFPINVVRKQVSSIPPNAFHLFNWRAKRMFLLRVIGETAFVVACARHCLKIICFIYVSATCVRTGNQNAQLSPNSFYAASKAHFQLIFENQVWSAKGSTEVLLPRAGKRWHIWGGDHGLGGDDDGDGGGDGDGDPPVPCGGGGATGAVRCGVVWCGGTMVWCGAVRCGVVGWVRRESSEEGPPRKSLRLENCPAARPKGTLSIGNV